MTVDVTEPLSDPALKVMLHEADAIQGGINRSYGAIYTSFGVAMPALIGIFAFAAKDFRFTGRELPYVAVAFVMVFALGGLWAQSLWMELLRYVHYKYAVLMPRLYHGTSRRELNYLQWSRQRSAQRGFPILLFNLASWLVLLTVHAAFIATAPWFLNVLSAAFIVAVTASTIAVMREARLVAHAIEESRRECEMISQGRPAA